LSLIGKFTKPKSSIQTIKFVKLNVSLDKILAYQSLRARDR